MTDVETAVGDEFEVELEGVPTAGFRWEASPPEPACVRLLGDEVEAARGRAGGPAVQRFRFEALASGEAELRFAYRRPWEPGPPRAERSIRVTVR